MYFDRNFLLAAVRAAGFTVLTAALASSSFCTRLDRIRPPRPRSISARLSAQLAAADRQPAAADRKPAAADRKILVIHYYGSDLPSIELFDRGFLAAIGSSSPNAVDFDVEHLDLPRFSSANDAALLAAHLRQKYEGTQVRAVVAVTDAALLFLRTYRLFRDVPTVAFTEGRPPRNALDLERHVVRVWAGPTAADTMAVALRLHPSTRHIVVLKGEPNNDREFEKEVRAQLASLDSRVDVTYLTDLTSEQALAAVKTLSSDSLILLLGLAVTDSTPHDFGPSLSSASTVPIYALRDTLIGYGAVGGYVSDTMAAGSQVAALAILLALGARSDAFPPERSGAVPMFDWRELQRWRIREGDLPPGSQILFKELSAWERYRWYILGAVTLVGTQTALIAALIAQRSRRRQSERRNTAILRAVPDLMFLQTRDGVFVDYHAPNPGQLLLRPEQFLGKNMRDVLPTVMLHAIEPAFAQAADASGPVVVEYALDLPDGNKQYEARLVRNNNQVLTLVRDITERKRSADQFRLALETVTTGMLTIDRAGRIVLVNAYVETLFGYRREELIDQPAEMLVPERLHGMMPGEHGGVPSGVTAAPMRDSHEFYGLHKDGTEIPVRIGFNALHTSEGEFVLCSITDITERRQAEREREDLTRHLQDLAGRLIAAQEVERARIARDLHDDVSQQLAVLSIALSGFKRRVAAVSHDTGLQADVASLEQRTRTLAESVRDLSHDLHPDVLRHIGLAAALTTHCNELSLSPTLRVTCTAQGDLESIDPEAALCLYRIAQEALHNVVKHAHASQAEVRLLRTDDGVEMTVADNGKGFDLQRRKSGTGLGLVGMTERVRLASGTLSVVTAVNEGTQVRIQLPITARTTTVASDLPLFRDFSQPGT